MLKDKDIKMYKKTKKHKIMKELGNKRKNGLE